MKIPALKSLFEAAAQIMIPQIVEEGFANIPEQAKPVAIHVLAPLKSEFATLAKKTTGTSVDDAFVEKTYAEMAEYAASKGKPNYIQDCDEFVAVQFAA